MNDAVKYNIKNTIKYLLLYALAIVFIFPFIWMILSSFKELRDIYQMTLLPVNSQTGEMYISFENYAAAFKRLDLRLLYKNTLFVAVLNTGINLFFNSMAAYGFARLRFPGRDAIFKMTLTGLMLPGTVLLIPNLFIVKALGMYNTRAALILPVIMSVYNVFLTRQAFLNSSRDIEESARIDGCSRFGVFFRMALPLNKPVLITLGIFTFLYNYNNLMQPLLYINDPDKYMLQQGLANIMVHNRGANYEILLAASVMVALPLILLFILLQRHIVDGIQIGGVKG